jgi:hypothetical protein
MTSEPEQFDFDLFKKGQINGRQTNYMQDDYTLRNTGRHFYIEAEINL